ncbi:hypothetical protein [Flavobacterium lipolyticum]|uniref:RDD domain-containing protein n=1 Tax=Flavobacterium lipolyticum TaxID=2893754 RepID=A0ABS8M2P8_9FLAO|nr:hypothetical protein [Flavobacterium sp. F-126]MCC9018949.1 hypothetical protein [Flavobacterium sp. F-126]
MIKGNKPAKKQKKESLPSVKPIEEESKKNTWVGDLTYPVRDVLIASMANGLFLIAVVALIITVFIYRLPSEQLLIFAKDVYTGFDNLYILGWILWIITCAAWLFHVKYIGKRNNKEILRLSDEKDKYQKLLFEKAIN